MMDYLVLDVETPNSKNDSICAIGVQLLTDNKVTQEWYTLVDPEDKFDDFNISIHHITPEMVSGAPKFDDVWARISPYCENRVFVAHNAQFDLTVLAKALQNRGIQMPVIRYLCTVDLGRRIHFNFKNTRGDLVLSGFSRHLGVELVEHHNALYDTRACCGIFLRLQEMYDFDPMDYVRQYVYANKRLKRKTVGEYRKTGA